MAKDKTGEFQELLKFPELKTKKIHGRTEEATKARQNQFLEAFSQIGIIKPSCMASYIDPSTVSGWRTKDVFGFSDRFEEARQGVHEVVEYKGLVWKLLNDPKCHHMLVIFYLKNNLPDKYGDTAVNDDSAILLEMYKQKVQESKNRESEEELPQLTAQQEAEIILMNKKP